MTLKEAVNLTASLEEEVTWISFFYLIDLTKKFVNSMNVANFGSGCGLG